MGVIAAPQAIAAALAQIKPDYLQATRQEGACPGVLP